MYLLQSNSMNEKFSHMSKTTCFILGELGATGPNGAAGPPGPAGPRGKFSFNTEALFKFEPS